MRSLARQVSLVLLGALASGCAAPRAEPARQPWAPPTYAPPVYVSRGSDAFAMPGGSEARDPWGARSMPPAAPTPTAPPAPPAGADGGAFLLLTALYGPLATEREPAVNAVIARLGGVRRAASLWEVTPQPGGGLASIAAALEGELCAEDVVVVYRARRESLERSEFAGHKVCPVPAPAAPTAKPRPPVDPLRTRY